MSFFRVGKYEVRAWAFGSMRPNGRRMKGHWSISDPTIETEEPILTGACSIDRETDVEAINDAMIAGRVAADKLLKKHSG